MSTATLDLSGTRPTPLRRLVLVELRKSYDTRAGFWLLFTIALLITLIELVTLIAVNAQDALMDFTAFTGSVFFVCLVLAPLLGIMLVTTEWSQRSAMVTFALEPERLKVLAAKLVTAVLLGLATVVLMFAVATVCTAICEVLQPELTQWAVEWQFLLVGAPLTLTVTMLFGFALACLFLNTPASIVSFLLIWLTSLPVLGVIAGLIPAFEDAVPWLAVQINVLELSDGFPGSASEWGQLLVTLLVWIVVPLGLGAWRILRAEVK
ncbi:MAG TPA: ABC transporter permease [Nocardioides sp.]|nr:ABC transporter permease [Nocardioides sp.]